VNTIYVLDTSDGNTRQTGRVGHIDAALLRLLGDSTKQKKLSDFIANRLVVTDFGCHHWLGTSQKKGYGVICFWGAHVRAHRVAWVLAKKAAIPADKMIMHRCNNRACVNPAHLELGTNTENMQHAKRSGSYTHVEKLTRAKVLQAAAWNAAGISQRQIAKRLGVNPAVINDAMRGKAWSVCWPEVKAILAA